MKIIRLAKALLSKNSWFVGAFQACLIFLSLILAWFLRFDFTLPDRRLLFSAACLLIVIRMSCYRGLWPVAWLVAIHGPKRCARCCEVCRFRFRSICHGDEVCAEGREFSPDGLCPRTPGNGRDPDWRAHLLARAGGIGSSGPDASRKVLLIGAGIGAQTVVREIKRPGSDTLLSDTWMMIAPKLGLKIEGIPVMGTVDQLSGLGGSTQSMKCSLLCPRPLPGRCNALSTCASALR